MRISVCPKCYEQGKVFEGEYHCIDSLYTFLNYKCPNCNKIYEEKIVK